MAGTMYDYLNTVTPDYSGTLSLSPLAVLPESGGKLVMQNTSDDGAIEAVILSSAITFTVELSWAKEGTDDIDTIFDFYFDSNKANGQAKSFKWEHPLDGHVYVAKFTGLMVRERYARYSAVQTLTLNVIGRIADA